MHGGLRKHRIVQHSVQRVDIDGVWAASAFGAETLDILALLVLVVVRVLVSRGAVGQG